MEVRRLVSRWPNCRPPWRKLSKNTFDDLTKRSETEEVSAIVFAKAMTNAYAECADGETEAASVRINLIDAEN
jgi:hypothetical protein